MTETTSTESPRFLKACRREPVDRTPVWMMRQAGRYLEEYREIRRRMSFLEMCRTPETAAEVTLQPIDRFGFDAAVLFSDILIPVAAMGMDLEFIEGRGPVMKGPVRSEESLKGITIPDSQEAYHFVAGAIRILLEKLPTSVPLIGFAGAPFTLASYMVEGGGSKDFSQVKSMMFSEPGLYKRLLERITEGVAGFLNLQIAAGVQAVQIFDTWAAVLTPEDYRAFALPYTKTLIDMLDRKGVPVILYVNGVATLLDDMAEAGADVLGVDWRTDLDRVRARVGPGFAVQGNLDPCVLFGPPETIEGRVRDVLDRAGPEPGHIFNLGHGVLPQTQPEHVQAMVEAVHKWSARS